MIANDHELQVTLERNARIQKQVAELRRNKTNPTNYRLAASGYLAEIDRMQLIPHAKNQHDLTFGFGQSLGARGKFCCASGVVAHGVGGVADF